MEYCLVSKTELGYFGRSETSKSSFFEKEKALADCIRNLQENYLKIGYLLYDIDRKFEFCSVTFIDSAGQQTHCHSIQEYARIRFGLSQTVVSNSIAIVQKFCKDGVLLPGLENYGYSALSEMVPLTKGVWRFDNEIGYLPEWVKEEIKPEMTVKEIREVKKRHKPVKACSDVGTAFDDSDANALEYCDDEIAEEKIVSGWHKFKNDNERKLIFKHYREWEVFSRNEYLGLTYYRINVGNGVHFIAIEWKTEDKYYVKENGGFLKRFYIMEKDKLFQLHECSVGTLVNIIKSRNLQCPETFWEQIKA